MRILHVTDHFPPALGGIETHVSSLAARQHRAGHDVGVLTWQRRHLTGAELADDPFPVTRARSRLEVPVDPRAFDVVHAHVSVVAPFTAPVVARWARHGVPTVVTVHSLWSGLGRLPGWAAAVSGLLDAPVTWTAVSDVAATSVAALLPRGSRVGVVPNAVDVAARPHTPSASGRPLRIVSTMRIARRKRPLPLVEVFAGVRHASARAVELTIVGDGPQLPRLRRALVRRGLDGDVHLTGRLTASDVIALVAGQDVYVAPARLESFGLAALEARALGLPVVGFEGSGLTGFVRSAAEGLLARDDRGLGQALRHLADDADLLHEIAEHNRTHSPGFTWDRSLAAHERLYDQVAAGRPIDSPALPR